MVWMSPGFQSPIWFGLVPNSQISIGGKFTLAAVKLGDLRNMGEILLSTNIWYNRNGSADSAKSL